MDRRGPCFYLPIRRVSSTVLWWPEYYQGYVTLTQMFPLQYNAPTKQHETF